MTGRARVSFAASAFADLEDILKFYTEQDALQAGQRLVSEILSRIEPLAAYPNMGRQVPEFGVEHLRELIHPPFRIVYRLDPGRVRVVRVWRGERPLKLPES